MMKIHLNFLGILLIIILSVLATLSEAVPPTCTLCQAENPTFQCSQSFHKFCKNCVETKAIQQLENGGVFGRKLACPGQECAYWIHETQIRRCLSLPRNIERFRALRANEKLASERTCECCLASSAAGICTDGHALCPRCLEFESKEQLAGNREPVSEVPHMKCPALGCRLKLPESLLKRTMTASEYKVRSRILRQQLNTEFYNRCKVCGKKGQVIRRLDHRLLCDLIKCTDRKCGATCCAECGVQTNENHQCDNEETYQQWKDFLKKATPCPKCRRFIERNEGCFVMRCKCGTKFCYECGDFKNEEIHGWFDCTNSCLKNYRDDELLNE